MRRGLMRYLIACLALSFSTVMFGGVDIVKDGKAQAEIVIGKRPARMAKLAAMELSKYIEKISGAKLKITDIPDNEQPIKIYVGKSEYTDKLKLSTDGLAHGAFRMVSGNDWLALLGPDMDYKPVEPWARKRGDSKALEAWDKQTGETFGFPYVFLHNYYSKDLDVWKMDDAGTFNAVCEFLRRLGVRWYMPGEIGEVVPKMKTIALPKVDETVKPDFPMRRVTYFTYIPENFIWNMRIGENFGHELMGATQHCHGLKWVHMRDEVKKTHPEWYALSNGRRITDLKYTGAPCLSSKGLYDKSLKLAKILYDVHNEVAVSLDMCDGVGAIMCQCPKCEGKNTPERGWDGASSDYVFDFINRQAMDLHKSNPDRKVSALSYSSYKLPPKKIDKLSPNIALIMCQQRKMFDREESRDEQLNLRKAWLDKLPSKEIYIYDYYLNAYPRYGYGHVPVYYPHLIAEDLRSLKGVSKGDMIEVYSHPENNKLPWHALAAAHLNLYVTSRLLWDVDQDLDALLDDYYQKFYGPASKQMKEFVEFSEKSWKTIPQDAKAIDKLFALLKSAKKAAGDGLYGKRVDLMMEFVKPLEERKEKIVNYRKDVPEIHATECGGKDLKLDGKLDEPFWENAPTYKMRDIVSGGKTNEKTTVKIAWANKKIIFGVRCEEPDMKGIVDNCSQNDELGIFSNDHIELFVETQTHNYYLIAITPKGVVLDMDCQHGRKTLWSSEAEIAVDKGSDYWTLEFALPTADLVEGGIDANKKIEATKPTAKAPWFFNIYRQRERDKKVKLSGVAPTGKARFYVPDKFAKLLVKE